MKKLNLKIIAFLLLSSLSALAETKDSVKTKLVKDFYEELFAYHYKKFLKKVPEMRYSNSFSKLQDHLNEACRKFSEGGPCEYGADSDAQYRSQDFEDGLTLKNTEFFATESKPGLIEVEFKLFPKASPTQKNKFQISLIEEGGVWAVDDFIENGKSDRARIQAQISSLKASKPKP